MVAAALALLLLALSGASHAGTAATLGASVGSDTSDALLTYFIYPDVQEYASQEVALGLGPGNSDPEKVAEWACSQKATYNIRAAVAMGDMVKTGTSLAEYGVITRVADAFEACGIPFLPLFGNHEAFDGAAAPQKAGKATDATLFHENMGAAVMDGKPWFAGHGERPVWRERDLMDLSDIYLEGAEYGSRSYWTPIPPLHFVMAEWEFGIRLVDPVWRPDPATGAVAPASNAEGWSLDVANRYPGAVTIFVTHAGPCDSLNCDLRPEEPIEGPFFFPQIDPLGISGRGYGWKHIIYSSPANVIAYLGGHYNRGARGCRGGSGAFGTGVRDDLSRWAVGIFDFNCIGRTDPVAGALCDDASDCSMNPYTWQGWLQVNRQTRELCLQTVRTIDVDTDNDGVENAGAATLVIPPDTERGSPPFSDPDPAILDSFCNEWERYDAGGPDACPNHPRTCMTLPVSLGDL